MAKKAKSVALGFGLWVAGFAYELDGQQPSTEASRKVEETLIRSCLVMINPFSGGLDRAGNTKEWLKKFSPPRWDSSFGSNSEMFMFWAERKDQLTGQKVRISIELKKLIEQFESEKCGPEQLFLSQMQIEVGKERNVLVGRDATLALGQIN